MSEERARIALVGLFAAFTLAAGVLIGRATKPAHHTASAAVVVVGGGAGGGLGTPAGARAAADNYLASAAQTVEQDPAGFAALVAAVYAPASRASTLTQAAQAR